MITGLNHITLAVRDVARSFVFYKDILGFKPLVKWHSGAYLLVGSGPGDVWFCLSEDETALPRPDYTHYAFTVAQADFETARERLRAAGIEPFKENNSPGKSFYFKDPDGHQLELHAATWHDRLAAKKADPGRWQEVEWFE